MVVRMELILLYTAVISRYWMLSEAVVNVCELPDNRRQSLNASCDFETSQCTAGFTSPMSNYWTLTKRSIANNLHGDHSRNGSGTYYLFNAANYFPKGDPHKDQLKLPLVNNSNICLRFWYNLVSVRSNLKVIVNGHTILDQSNVNTHGWVQKYFFITYRAPVQIIFESTKTSTLGYVGVDDVVVEIEKSSSTTKGSGSTRLSSKSFTSSSTAKMSTHTTPNRAITLTSLKSARTTRTSTSRAHIFTNSLHTTKHAMRTTALVTSIGTHKAIAGTNKTSLSTKHQSTTAKQNATTAKPRSAITSRRTSTTARQTDTTVKPRSAITSRRTASTTVHLSTTANMTIVSITTAKKPFFVSVTTAATKPSLKPISTTKTTTTYASTTPTILASGRFSKISQNTTVATSPSSVRNYSTPVPTRQPAFTYFMTTATQSASLTTITMKPSATHKSTEPTFTSLVTSKPSISKSDPVNNITSPKSTISHSKYTTSATNRRTTRRRTDSATILLSATTTEKNVSRTVPFSTTAHRSSLSTTTAKTLSIINMTTATSKPPFKTTHTTKTTTTYVSTTPVRFTFSRLSRIANSTTSAISLSSARHVSTSVPTRQPTFTYWMTTTPKSSFASTPTTKQTTINTLNTYKSVNLVNTSIYNIINTVHVTHIHTPKSTTANNNTSIASVTTQSTTHMKPASTAMPLSATTTDKTASKTASVSATAHRISASSTFTKSPTFISAMTSSVQSPFKTTPTVKFTTSYSSTLPIISKFDRSTAMLTTSLATSPSSVIKFATSIPTMKPSSTYAMTTGTKSSLTNSPTTNPTTTSIYTVTKLISWVRTRTSTSHKPDRVTNKHSPKTTNITITSSTSTRIPRTDHVTNVSTNTPISPSSTKETTSTIVPLSAITHKTNPTATTVSNSKLQSTNFFSSTNSPTTNSTTTRKFTVTKFITWVRTRIYTSHKPDPVTNMQTEKTTNITITSTTTRIPRTDHITNVSTSAPISSSSTKETTSTIAPLSVITHTTNPTAATVSNSKLQSTNTLSTNTPTPIPKTTFKSTVTKLITWVRTRTSTSHKPDHVTNKHTPKTTNITITSTSTRIPRTGHITNVSTSAPISSSSTKETTSTIVPLSVITHTTNPTVAAVSNSKLQSTNTSSVSVFVTFVSNSALALTTTKRPVISSIITPIYVPDTTVPTTTSTPGNTMWTSTSKIIPSSGTRNRTIVSTHVPSLGATGKFASSTKPLLETVFRTLVSKTASKSVNEPNTTMSTIVSIAADTQRPRVETFTPTSTALPKMSSSKAATKLTLILNSSRSTISTSSKSVITASMNTSANTKVNSFKAMLLSAVQTDPSILSFTEFKSVTTSASNYQDIKSSASTQPDSISRTEPRSPAASEIFKVTSSSSRTMKTTTTIPVENTTTSPVENTTTSLVETNTQINVQINSFTQKEVKSTVTSSTLFTSISPGNNGRFDKPKFSSGGSSGKETLITAILCALAGMLLLIIVFAIILRRKNGRSPLTVMANKLNIKLFENPNDGTETVLIQLREVNN